MVKATLNQRENGSHAACRCQQKTLQPENTVAKSGSIRSSALPSCEMSHLVHASQPTQQHHNAVAA